MSKIGILDCTLRDGGYVNSFDFGEKGIKRIIKKLTGGGIDIIECGFLMNKPYDANKTIFNDVALISRFMPSEKKGDSMYVAMIALGDIPIEMIEERKDGYIDGIRVTFHKHQIKEALDFIKKIKNKGYKVFIQPVGTTSYTDEELLDLVKMANEIMPFAFYLVDTLSILYKDSILHMFNLVDKHLDKSIKIGYHSHNNLQLAFSNAQELIDLNADRDIILDASVFGMGRGAGNLCTELIIDYINKSGKNYYNIVPILDLLDGEISINYGKTPWGYNTPYYLASTHKCHPNYASYLLNMQTISARDINAILNSIPVDKRDLFNKELIEKLYKQYQTNSIDDKDTRNAISQAIGDRPVLVLGAGKTIVDEKEKVINFINDKKPFVISINSIDLELGYNPDMYFFSNSKKFNDMEQEQLLMKNVVVTSNIIKEVENKYVYPVNYSSLLIANQYVFDNAGLMIIKLLVRLKVNEIYLAGYDGFSYEASDYIKQQLLFSPERKEFIDLKNINMKNEIDSFKTKVNISFVTPSLYE